MKKALQSEGFTCFAFWRRTPRSSGAKSTEPQPEFMRRVASDGSGDGFPKAFGALRAPRWCVHRPAGRGSLALVEALASALLFSGRDPGRHVQWYRSWQNIGTSGDLCSKVLSEWCSEHCLKR